jgi:hypothetical protein
MTEQQLWRWWAKRELEPVVESMVNMLTLVQNNPRQATEFITKMRELEDNE